MQVGLNRSSSGPTTPRSDCERGIYLTSSAELVWRYAASLAQPALVLTRQRYETALDSCDSCRPDSRGGRQLGASTDGGRIARSGSDGRRSPHLAASGLA